MYCVLFFYYFYFSIFRWLLHTSYSIWLMEEDKARPNEVRKKLASFPPTWAVTLQSRSAFASKYTEITGMMCLFIYARHLQSHIVLRNLLNIAFNIRHHGYPQHIFPVVFKILLCATPK